MVKLDGFTSNVVTVINEILTSQTICKYLYYQDSAPQTHANIADTSTLMFKNLFPYPFNPSINDTDTIQIRVYYPKGKFETYEIITNAYLCFDIIIPNTMYLVRDENDASKVRPYEIMKQIVNHFTRNSVGTLGIIHFKEFFHLSVNDKYDCVRLTSETMSLGG